MAKLKFKQDDKGNNTKVALGMYSKDGEYVDLDQECDLGGQVSLSSSYITFLSGCLCME